MGRTAGTNEAVRGAGARGPEGVLASNTPISRRGFVGMGLAMGAGLAATQPGGPSLARAGASESASAQADEAATTDRDGEGARAEATFGDVDAFLAELEAAGCVMQRGSFQELDTLEMASEGMLVSCFGNNAGSHYLVNYLPPAPNQDPAPAVEQRGWPAEEPSSLYDPQAPDNYPANPYFSPVGWSYKLRADEAVVMLGEMPPECAYFSLVNYLLLASVLPGKDYTNARSFFQIDGAEGVGSYHPIFGSLGMPANQFSMATEATPGQAGAWGATRSAVEGLCEGAPSAFGARFVYVMTGDEATFATVEGALEAAGFGAGLVNWAPLPAQTLNMGLEGGRDTFCTLGRVSQPVDDDAMQAWFDGLATSMCVVRVTPRVPNASPVGARPIVTRGTNAHETAQLPQAKATLDAIRTALIERYADAYDFEEPDVDIAVPEGMTAYLNDRNALGDNHDTTYLMTADFTLDSDEDFVVVYGVNHTATAKAVYSNAILYARPMLNGVCSVYDGLFAGSADSWLPEGGAGTANPEAYYVYTMARGEGNPAQFRAEIPYSTGNEQGVYYGVDNGSTVLVAFRAYVEPATGVGASYYEICWDRAIVFHRRAPE